MRLTQRFSRGGNTKLKLVRTVQRVFQAEGIAHVKAESFEGDDKRLNMVKV